MISKVQLQRHVWVFYAEEKGHKGLQMKALDTGKSQALPVGSGHHSEDGKASGRLEKWDWMSPSSPSAVQW